MCVCVCLLTHDDEEDASHSGAALLYGGGVVRQPDAGHRHEDQQHPGEAEQAGADHQSPRRLDVGWEGERGERAGL